MAGNVDDGSHVHVARAGGVSVFLKQGADKQYTAWAVIGIPAKHAEAEKAIAACLEQAKPIMGMKVFERMRTEFDGLLAMVNG